MAYKNFTPTILSSSEVQTYLMNQSVMVFANSAARAAALTAPTEGMTTYLQDTNTVELYDGSAWRKTISTITTETYYNSSGGNAYLQADSANYIRVGAGGAATAFFQNNYDGILISSNGKVRLPYQPAFKAHPNGNPTVNSGDVMPLTATSINVGSHYNTSNYRFTAPVSGTYIFIGNLRINQDQAYIHSNITFNGSTGSRQYSELPALNTGSSGLSFTAGAFAYMRYMNLNDYIQFVINNYVGGSFVLHEQTYLAGWLMG